MQDGEDLQTVEEIVALLKRLDSLDSQEALNLRALSSKIDNNSIENKTSQYIPSISILNKLGIVSYKENEFRPRVTTVVDVFLYFKELGIKFDEGTKLVLKHPQIATHSIDNLEDKRKYLSLAQKEFGALILKHPQIADYSIENLENKRRYLNLAQSEFGALILKFPQIIGCSIDNLETKFKFYESRLNLKRKDIVLSIINNEHKDVQISYSMYKRVMPRYVLYRRMLREKDSEFDPDEFLKLLNYSDGRFISKIGDPKDLAERNMDGKVEVVDLKYERAKNLCKLMRNRGSSALKSKLAA